MWFSGSVMRLPPLHRMQGYATPANDSNGLPNLPKRGRMALAYKKTALKKAHDTLYVLLKEMPPSAKIVGISFVYLQVQVIEASAVRACVLFMRRPSCQ